MQSQNIQRNVKTVLKG